MIPLYGNVRRRAFPFVTLLLIALNVLVFAFWQRDVGMAFSAQELALYREELVGRFGITHEGVAHLFTYMFLHGSWMHLLLNMWVLWIFGIGTEEAMGGVRFLIFYLLCGAIGGVAHVIWTTSRWAPLVGASGAISGVLGAYLVLYPRAKIITLIPIFIFARIIAIPAWVFLLVWIGIQIASQVFSARGTGVAYLAHIGGFAAGLLLVWVFRPAAPPRLRRQRIE